MATLTIADLDNGKRDLETVDAVANSQADTTPTRYGPQTLTLAGALRRLGWQAPVPYAPGLNVDSPTMTVERDGIVYRPDPALVPFTTAEWNPDQWRVVQNTQDSGRAYQFASVAEAQSAAATLPDGSSIIVEGESQGHVAAGAYVPDSGTPAVRLQNYTALGNYAGAAAAVDITSPGIAGRFYRRGAAAANGVFVIKDALNRSWERADFTDTIHTAWAGAKGDKTTDDTAALQAVLDIAIASAGAYRIAIDGISKITSSLIINRMVDTTRQELVISGGGIYVTTAITIFDSTLPFTIYPTSEHIKFQSVVFEASDNNMGAYVMNGKFLRVVFSECYFDYIKAFTSTTYSQDIRFLGGKARGWKGLFFQSNGAFYIEGDTLSMEHGGGGFYLVSPGGAHGVVGCSMHQNLFEGCSGNFVTATRLMGFSASGNYFEGNSVGAFAFNYNTTPNRGVSITGNLFIATEANKENPNYAEISWGVTTGGHSAGNHCDSTLHNAQSVLSPVATINDSAPRLFKGGGTGITDATRGSAGLSWGTDPNSGLVYSGAGGGAWIGIDRNLGALVVGSDITDGATIVPRRLLWGTVSPQVSPGYYGDAYWAAGSRIMNSLPSGGQPKGWICVTSGKPGVWTSEGNL